jgi:hypothetical protein
MNKENILTMKDIQVSDILYYDPTFKEECYKFCKERDIDSLPALEDSRKIFWRQPETLDFREEAVSDERIVADWQNIFDPGLADKFARSSLLLVFSHDMLTGVVHFSDYNKPVVSLHLYKVFLAYEKALRTILELHGYHNKHMIEYFQDRIASPEESNHKGTYTRKIKEYQKRAGDIENSPEFQSFYLRDLIELAEHKDIIFVENRVTELRNMVMHAHDFVHMEDPHTPDFIYNPKTFQDFFGLAITLHKDYKRTANHLSFINKPRTTQEHHA